MLDGRSLDRVITTMVYDSGGINSKAIYYP